VEGFKVYIVDTGTWWYRVVRGKFKKGHRSWERYQVLDGSVG